MRNWQATFPELPAPFSVETTGEESLVVRVNGERGAEFRVLEITALTSETAERDAVPAARESQRPLIVVYDRSSPDARALLREAGVSYAGRDGRVLLQAPPLWVDRDRPRPRAAAVWDATPAGRNPFAVRGSRVARWLLLHPREAFTISELAGHTELSVPAVSRVVQALDDLALVSRTTTPTDARTRAVQLRRPRDLLEAWLPIWQRRRLQRATWDIGARDAAAAIELLRSTLTHDPRLPLAVGGVAGAATIRRVVEPTTVLVWVDGTQIAELRGRLAPEPAGTDRGALRVLAAPDPWTLELARDLDGLPVADPVQLWLDCSSGGERAIEAAEAVAEEMGW